MFKKTRIPRTLFSLSKEAITIYLAVAKLNTRTSSAESPKESFSAVSSSESSSSPLPSLINQSTIRNHELRNSQRLSSQPGIDDTLEYPYPT